jgi:hypothetical protein
MVQLKRSPRRSGPGSGRCGSKGAGQSFQFVRSRLSALEVGDKQGYGDQGGEVAAALERLNARALQRT